MNDVLRVALDAHRTLEAVEPDHQPALCVLCLATSEIAAQMREKLSWQSRAAVLMKEKKERGKRNLQEKPTKAPRTNGVRTTSRKSNHDSVSSHEPGA